MPNDATVGFCKSSTRWKQLAFTLLAIGGGHVFAATPRCGEALDPADAGIEVLRCEGGLVIFAETTAIRSSAPLMSRHPHAIQLDDGALLVIAPASVAPFATLTRDAVTSGEGEWIVLSRDGQTRVDPIRGRVVSRLRIDNSEIVLGEGGASATEARLDEVRLERLKEASRRWRREQ